ncbi:MAG TPA: DUF3343 domain-containing protein [Feifaniaceae bacterium]|nr:DUF3343 domain-containing protein [Feifaniaceae bacterium]
MRDASFYMLSFSSAHHALQAEQYLKPKVPVCTMPTLRAVSKSCGISLRIGEDGRGALKAALLQGFPVPRDRFRVFYVKDSLPAEISPQEL